MSEVETNQSTFKCPICARVVVIYVRLASAPVCMRCGKPMLQAPADIVPGQLSLFSASGAKRK